MVALAEKQRLPSSRRRPRAAAGSASPRATALPRRPAAGDRADRADARRARPRRRGGVVGVPLLPLHPGPGAGRGHRARRHHLRPRRGGARADGRRDRGRRPPHARGAGRRGRRERPSRPEPLGDPPPPEDADPLASGDVHGTLREVIPTTRSSCSSRPRRRWRCATGCASRAPGATTSAPAAGSATASRARSACSSPSPTGRSSASSARARRSTRSRACGRRRPTRCPSPSW